MSIGSIVIIALVLLDVACFAIGSKYQTNDSLR